MPNFTLVPSSWSKAVMFKPGCPRKRKEKLAKEMHELMEAIQYSEWRIPTRDEDAFDEAREMTEEMRRARRALRMEVDE